MLRVARWVAIAVLAFAALVAGEIWLALRRDYLPTDNPLELDGAFGDEGAPRLSFVVLGDSTAAGIGVDDADDAYPTVLARRLAEATDHRVELSAFGISGARVSDVANDQVGRVAAREPDLVFVGIGANDVTHVTSLDDVRDDMTQVIRDLKATGAVVVVAGPPDMRALAWHQPLRWLAGVRGNQVTDAVEDAAAAEGVEVVDLAGEAGPFFEEDPEGHFSSDEFHPGPLGYRRWADAIFPVLLDAYLEASETSQ